MKKVTVYLDSSDISVMSIDDKKIKPEIQEIKNKLIQLKKENKVDFLFSDVLVAECFPRDKDPTEAGGRNIPVSSMKI